MGCTVAIRYIHESIECGDLAAKTLVLILKGLGVCWLQPWPWCVIFSVLDSDMTCCVSNGHERF